MAQSRLSGDMQAVELKSFRSSKRCLGHFVSGRHLSIRNADSILAENTRSLNLSGKTMRERLTNAKPHDFQLMRVPFLVSVLQHVTDKNSLQGICQDHGFKASILESRPEIKDLLFWSAEILPETITSTQKKACDKLKSLNIPNLEEYEESIQKQYVNSPALITSSSYFGNFRFSFPLSDLLLWYGEQHCGDRKPQMRILGTELFKQEISHVIVLHSPDTDAFNDLPEVPALQSTSSEPLLFVYWLDEMLYWNPESTSAALNVKISEAEGVKAECYKATPCFYYQDHGYCGHCTYCVWNHLVFAFHLPDQGLLRVPVQQLLKNVTACEKESLNSTTDQQKLLQPEAERVIQELKRKML